jgi:uncharacterized integral membrane protein
VAAPAPPAKKRSGVAGVSWKTIALVVLGLYILLLVIVNSERVKLDFVVFHANTRVFFLVLLSFLLGAGVMWLIPRLKRKSNAREKG